MIEYKLKNAAAHKITVASSSKSVLELLDTAASDFNNVPINADAIDIYVESGTARFLNGETPTALIGFPLTVGKNYSLRSINLQNLNLISSDNAVLTVNVGQTQEGESDNFGFASDVKIEISDSDVVVVTETAAIAMNKTTAIGAEFKLLKVTCHFSAAPTTSENFTLTLDSVAGAAYDTVLYSFNPSLSAATDIVFLPDGDMKFKTGDELVATFTNTDACTYGLSIYYQLI